MEVEDIAQFGVHLKATVYFASDDEDGQEGSFDLWLGANEVLSIAAVEQRVASAIAQIRKQFGDETIHVASHDENQASTRVSLHGHIGNWPPEKLTGPETEEGE